MFCFAGSIFLSICNLWVTTTPKTTKTTPKKTNGQNPFTRIACHWAWSNLNPIAAIATINARGAPMTPTYRRSKLRAAAGRALHACELPPTGGR